jgi:hypothetical protein
MSFTVPPTQPDENRKYYKIPWRWLSAAISVGVLIAVVLRVAL